MVRSGVPISEIRAFVRERGNPLISRNAGEKARNLIFSPQDVYQQVLMEEMELKEPKQKRQVPKTLPSGSRSKRKYYCCGLGMLGGRTFLSNCTLQPSPNPATTQFSPQDSHYFPAILGCSGACAG